jgi:hypothetical protein
MTLFWRHLQSSASIDIFVMPWLWVQNMDRTIQRESHVMKPKTAISLAEQAMMLTCPGTQSGLLPW